MSTTPNQEGTAMIKPKPATNLTRLRPETQSNPIWVSVVADLGPVREPVDTEWTVLQAQAALAMAGRAP